MPSSVAHGLAAVALGTVLYPEERARLYGVAAAGSVLLDVDAVGRPLGLGDIGWLGGHRAFTHSLTFAATLALAALAVACRGPHWHRRRLGAWAYLALAFALHGALDAFTTYGEGVMFLAPFSVWRYKASWQPLHGLLPEMVAIWVPALYIIWYRRRERPAKFQSTAP